MGTVQFFSRILMLSLLSTAAFCQDLEDPNEGDAHRGVIEELFQNVEAGRYEDILSLFAPNATVYSPLYGAQKAPVFFKNMLADANQVQISIKNIFTCSDQPQMAAIWISFKGKMRQRGPISLLGVDLFEFAPDTGKIQSLTFYYDTNPIRSDFQKLHPKKI